MLLPLDLRLLWYFKRTAEIGSLTRAAAELGTSQPALTRHIMRLERELRVALLLRDQRGVTPTEAGALVLDKAESLLRLEQAMKDDIGALSRTIAGDVALCMPSSMHWIVTAPMTSVVAAKFPDIRLRLMDGFDHQSRAQLKSRAADIGVIVYDPDSVLDGGRTACSFLRTRQRFRWRRLAPGRQRAAMFDRQHPADNSARAGSPREDRWIAVDTPE